MANDATVKFGYDGTALNRGLADQDRRISASAKRTEASFSRMRGAVAGIGFGMLARESVRTVASLDRLRRGMTTLEGSVDGGRQRMDELMEAARLPGLEFEQAVKGDIRLRSVGLSAEMSKRSIIEMGNALALAGGSSADLDGVVLALTQIISKGKVSAEEINQIAERVPQVRAVMKDVFGTADTEALQKMNISSEEFISRLIDGFGRLERATAGLDEKMADFRTSINLATEAFAEGLVRQGVQGASQLGDALQDNTELIRELGTATATFFSIAGSAAKTANDTIVSAIAHIGLMIDGQTLAQANASIAALEQQRAAEKTESAEKKAIATTRESASVTVTAEQQKQGAIKKTLSLRDMEQRRNQEMASLKVLDLRSRGRNKEADKMEREAKIKTETQRIRKDTGASEKQAREMAEDRVRLEEKVSNRESGQRNRIIARPRGDGGMRGNLDAFHANQIKDEVGFNEAPFAGYGRGDQVHRNPIGSGFRTPDGGMRGNLDAFYAKQRGSGSMSINTSGASTQQTVNAARKDDLSSKIDRTNELLSRGLLGS